MVSYPGAEHSVRLLTDVLILIVMDNGLLPEDGNLSERGDRVLILIVMDNGLLRLSKLVGKTFVNSLNPYCNG